MMSTRTLKAIAITITGVLLVIFSFSLIYLESTFSDLLSLEFMAIHSLSLVIGGLTIFKGLDSFEARNGSMEKDVHYD